MVALDTSRTWFRYHQLFADLLRLQLRRTRSGEVAALHRAAAGWLAGRGMEVEAIRHAQAARDWGLAARLLADQWPGLYGRPSTSRRSRPRATDTPRPLDRRLPHLPPRHNQTDTDLTKPC
ncbi:hypothetical protein ACGFYM_36205 [Streptomyces sp. NPDC048231]|uniref:hypothetical protein n=1 Tax=Streptomyces sp. NPDC048231 TaxID=3365519 RepID=UPI00371DBF23